MLEGPGSPQDPGLVFVVTCSQYGRRVLSTRHHPSEKLTIPGRRTLSSTVRPQANSVRWTQVIGTFRAAGAHPADVVSFVEAHERLKAAPFGTAFGRFARPEGLEPPTF